MRGVQRFGHMPITSDKKREVNVREAAWILGVFNSYVLSLIYAGKLKGTKKHGLWFLNRMEVEAYATRLRARRRSSSDVLDGDGHAV